jgi:hypothetical protein
MLTSGRISLVLPAGLDHRAAEITDAITRRLGALRLPASRDIERIVIDDLTGTPHLTPDGIAAHVVSAVERQLTQSAGAPPSRHHASGNGLVDPGLSPGVGAARGHVRTGPA